jgi:hypothetical protein
VIRRADHYRFREASGMDEEIFCVAGEEQKRGNAMRILVFLFFLFMIISGCQKTDHLTLWDRHCGACHDGKTVLNNQVVADKDQMKMKYRSLEEFASACSDSPSCMNIMKHEEKLFLDVGKEIGIKDTAR